jgi:GNAT superfamily N-acetyltransferase
VTDPAATASVQISQASAADAEAVGQLVATAFESLAVSEWLVSDPGDRRRILPPLFRIFADHALATGVIHVTADRAAAALWLPTGAEGPDAPEDYEKRLADATVGYTDRFTVFDHLLESHHPLGTAHHHLAMLAVHPDRQGQGLGTALIRYHHQELDRDQVPAYLEASGLRTRELYLHHGYADLGAPIQMPNGPRMYPMWRDPGAPAPGSAAG